MRRSASTARGAHSSSPLLAPSSRVLLLLLALLASLHVCTALSTFNYHRYDSLQFQVIAPEPMRGNLTYTAAIYGASIINPPGKLGLDLEIVNAYPDPTACTDLRGPDGIARTVDGRPYTNKAMLILRGDCTFGEKTLAAQLAGASIALVYSCSPAPPSLCKPDRDQMYSGSTLANLTTIMIDWNDGSILNGALQTCYPPPPQSQVMHPSLQARSDVQSLLPYSVASPDVPSNCSIIAFFPGTGPIHPQDRAGLTQMATDFVFTFENDRSGQSGSLPRFSAIQNLTLDPCINRVAGIWCQGTPGRIVVLDLDNMNITGILSDGIGQLTALQQLTLSDNNFWCTTLHCSIANLTELRVLNMFHMGLLGFQPPGELCLGTLTKLLSVDASYNKITELTDSMLQWRSLRAMNVANNQIISQLSVHSLTVFDNIEYLNFASNSIFMDLDGLQFNVLSKLNYLYMSANLLQGSLGWNSFDHLPGLLEVDLSNNHLIGRLPAFFGTNAVQRLDLSNNALSGNCTAWEMPNLLYLSLGSNVLTEPLESFPRRFQSLLYLDLSGNYLTTPSNFDDVGGFLFSILPLSVQTVHLEYNEFTGAWGPGFLTSFNTLSHFFMSNNYLTAIPDDLFEIGGSDTLIDLDLSYNSLVGTLPSLPPSPVIASVKFQGNPGLRDPNLQLPSWAMIDPKGSFTSDTDTYSCPSLVGTAYHLSVFIDPSYYGYQGCECSRGTYGQPPNCPEIPFSMATPSDTQGTGDFTDELFGDKRFFVGVDTSFVLGRFNLSIGQETQGIIAAEAEQDDSRNNGQQRSVRKAGPLRRFATVVENAGRNVHSVRLTDDDDASSSSAAEAVALSSDDGDDIAAVPPAPFMGVIRAIYITFFINTTLFWGQDESLTVYSGDLSLRGDRMVFWQGTDSSYVGNIDLGDMFPPQTVTILGSRGVINFRSRHASGQHFRANFTLSSNCPPGFNIVYDQPDVFPDGYCAPPPGSSASTTVILLLVTSVIIGMLALCLLGQKMSTIQGLINGESLHAPHEGLDTNQQAQEIYGPVLSVEEAWRRQLKRDLGKEVLMLLLELAGYISNWLVVFEEIHHETGPIRSDAFLILYMVVVVASTVSGSLSVFARVRVMREIFRELTRGLAVVPTIDMLLHHARRSKEEKQQRAVEVVDSTRSFEQFQRQKQRDAKANEDMDDSLGQRGGKNGALNAYGRPLLDSNQTALNSSDFEPDHSGMEMSVDTAHSLQQQGNRSRNGNGKNAPRSYSPSTGSGSGGGGHGFRSSTLQSSLSGDSDLSEESQHAVRLSSKDPNVQLAWVQRTISTTKLTSFNLIFSTLPFLILNQIRMFRNDSLVSDWALQVSSLFATMLLGVKLIRILALGELIQRRNELVFEVIIAGTGKAMLGGGGGGGTSAGGGGGGGNGGGGSDKGDHSQASPALPRALSHQPQHLQRVGSASGAKNPFTAPSSSFAGAPSSFLLASSAAGLGGESLYADSAAYDALPAIAPQSLMAPASSLASNASGSSALSPSSADAFHAPHAGVTGVPQAQHDQISSWAVANRGSSLQMQTLTEASTEADIDEEPSARPRSALPAAASISDPSSGNSSGNGANGSRTLSSNDWIEQHMQAEDQANAQAEAARMKTIKHTPL